jgi:hypothetical protein
MTGVALKAIRIVGLDKDGTFQDTVFNDGFKNKEGCAIIGDGKTPITEEDLREQLQGKIDSNTQIFIFAHGAVDKDKKHLIHLHKLPCKTSKILESLDKLTPGAVQIYLHSCYSGAANNDINNLKPGSTLVTSSSPDDITYDTPFCNPQLPEKIASSTKSSLVPVSPEEMFLHSLRAASHTITFNKQVDPRSSFKYTYRPFANRIIRQEHTVDNFVTYAEKEFIRSCFEAKSCTGQNFQHPLPQPLSDIEAKQSLVEHLAYMIRVHKVTGAELKEVIDKNNIDPNSENKYGWNLMCLAAINNNIEVIRALKEAGADPDLPNKHGWSPMCYAATHNKPEAIRALCEVGATPDKPDKTRWTPIQRAVQHNHTQTVALLAEIITTSPEEKEGLIEQHTTWTGWAKHLLKGPKQSFVSLLDKTKKDTIQR